VHERFSNYEGESPNPLMVQWQLATGNSMVWLFMPVEIQLTSYYSYMSDKTSSLQPMTFPEHQYGKEVETFINSITSPPTHGNKMLLVSWYFHTAGQREEKYNGPTSIVEKSL